MGKALFALGLLFGLLGLVWSFLTLAALAFVAALGGVEEVFLITILGFLGGAMAIVGGVVSLRWARTGAAVVLGAGGAALAALPVVVLLRPDLEASASEFLVASVALGWWAYVLVAVGVGALVVTQRRAGG